MTGYLIVCSVLALMSLGLVYLLKSGKLQVY